MNEHDEIYERWRRARADVEPPAPPEFIEQVMRSVRAESRPAPGAAAGRHSAWRRAIDWLDDHRWARAALVGGAAVVGVARFAALIAMLLALG